MSKRVDWEALARQLGAFEGHRHGTEFSSSPMAQQAIEILLEAETLRSAVDYYISGKPGSALARSVLWQIRPWSAMKYCYDIYKSEADVDTKRDAVELLRVVGDRRALKWVGEFLDDADAGIQLWGIGLVDQLLISDLVEPEEAESFLKTAENHTNPQVRKTAEFVREYLKDGT
ncbi:MAG: hypothetical protein KME01_08805 [Chroococcus sp. CMT-3BRIN-NPC107]|nr:hypothetical protein [Chroococcus sp. CMT-3BRIN-NPC107]